VPIADLVGAEGDGWRIAKYLLELERGSYVMSGHLERRVRHLRRLYALESERTGPMPESGHIEARLGELDLAVLNYSHLELKALLGQLHGALERAQASIVKILVTDLNQSIDDLSVDILGPAACYFRTERPLRSVGHSVAGRDYLEPYLPTMLANRGLSIEGGANEVQRNLIARAVLG
jgi:alkylation response protein AidB-like acyl-CoA dehydrogenase